ncbi:MAG TPA: outer membrane lipid asymmetry maintenance protein MlaD, partial [Gammaproteobacteria bacterium]
FDSFPIDSRASIYTAGLLGEQYIELVPGIEDDYLEDGSDIVMADSALILENLIGRFISEIIAK